MTNNSLFNKETKQIIFVVVFAVAITFLVITFFVTMVYFFHTPETDLEYCLGKCPKNNYGTFSNLECPTMCYDYLLNQTECVEPS